MEIRVASTDDLDDIAEIDGVVESLRYLQVNRQRKPNYSEPRHKYIRRGVSRSRSEFVSTLTPLMLTLADGAGTEERDPSSDSSRCDSW